jgi:hypothetical protein
MGVLRLYFNNILNFDYFGLPDISAFYYYVKLIACILYILFLIGETNSSIRLFYISTFYYYLDIYYPKLMTCILSRLFGIGKNISYIILTLLIYYTNAFYIFYFIFLLSFYYYTFLIFY